MKLRFLTHLVVLSLVSLASLGLEGQANSRLGIKKHFEIPMHAKDCPEANRYDVDKITTQTSFSEVKSIPRATSKKGEAAAK